MGFSTPSGFADEEYVPFSGVDSPRVHGTGSSSIYTQVEEDRHTHMQNANQVAPAALARAGVCTTGIVASKF